VWRGVLPAKFCLIIFTSKCSNIEYFNSIFKFLPVFTVLLQIFLCFIVFLVKCMQNFKFRNFSSHCFIHFFLFLNSNSVQVTEIPFFKFFFQVLKLYLLAHKRRQIWESNVPIMSSPSLYECLNIPNRTTLPWLFVIRSNLPKSHNKNSDAIAIYIK